jgi:hypothetical protein
MPTQEAVFTLGEPQVAGPLAVFPVFGPEPRLTYQTLARATGLGALVKELDEGASVNQLVVENPTDLDLLIFEGEEFLGAQQNRSFDVSVLVAAGSTLRLPVSCVERGRWDGRRHREGMRVAPQAADPSLRRVKRARANMNASRGIRALPDQGEVWDEVDRKFVEHADSSPTDSLHDLYESRRHDLGELTSKVVPVDGQVGALVQVAGAPVALDLVGRPDVFADLLPRLAQGYALDAVVAPGTEPSEDAAQEFLADALNASLTPVETYGLGQSFALNGGRITGSSLVREDETIQLSAFPAEPAAEPRSLFTERGQIRRPSARRVNCRPQP